MQLKTFLQTASNKGAVIFSNNYMSIFKERKHFKPYEYPDCIKFIDAINHSYWLHSELNFLSDIQDFKKNLNDIERKSIHKTLLAISQIEVKVKGFWSDLYKQIPKPEINAVGATFAECHAEGTEILTPKGWVDFRYLGDNKVAQYNSNGTMDFVKPTHYINSFYEGKLYNINKQSLETAITPNHRIVYFDNRNNFCSKSIEELGVKNTNNSLPESCKLTGNENILSIFDRLRIAIQADGNKRYWKNKNGQKIPRGIAKEKQCYEISVKKERKKERLLNILTNLGIEYRSFNDKRGYLKIEFDLDNQFDYKTFDWVSLENKSWLWCREFIEELSYWDGTRLQNKKDCLIKYSTTNKSSADIVQSVGVGANYKTNLIKRIDNRKDTYKDVYIVSFINNRERVSFSALKSDTFDYKGNVYCVTVPSGTIITRYKDKVFISGNSEVRHERSYSHLLEVLGLNDDFENLLEVPEIIGRVDYLSKYLNQEYKNDKRQFTFSLALFSIFVENVSLFSQFAIIMSFNRFKNTLKDISNIVEWTSKEELLHGQFGIYLINKIKEENPSWFNEAFYDRLYQAAEKAYNAESAIIDWIFSEGELDFLSKDVIKEFVKERLNDSLKSIGGEKIFKISKKLTSEMSWFNEEIYSTAMTDFFYKRPTSYAKRTKSVTEDDLF